MYRPARSKYRYHVAPRYTCGSPAQVSDAIAEQVAREEVEAAKRWQELDPNSPPEMDLQGIAYRTLEEGRWMKLLDLITLQEFWVPLKEWGDYSCKKHRWIDLTPNERFVYLQAKREVA